MAHRCSYVFCAGIGCCCRGEIVEPKSDDNAKTAPDGALEAPAMSYNDDDMSLKRKHDGVSAPPASSADAPSKKEEKVVLMRKDEFGRDVPEDKRSRKGGRKKKESKKRSHKKKKSRRESRSRSPSEPRGRLVGTPPPADPYRPQVSRARVCVCGMGALYLTNNHAYLTSYMCLPCCSCISSMRIATSALVIAAAVTIIVEEEVRAAVAREAVTDGDSVTVATVGAAVAAGIAIAIVESEALGAGPVLPVVQNDECVATRPTASSGRTTRSRIAARVPCAKWIRSTRPSQRRGSREPVASTCQRRTSRERTPFPFFVDENG